MRRIWYVIHYGYASKKYLVFTYDSRAYAEQMAGTIRSIYNGHTLMITKDKKLADFFW